MTDREIRLALLRLKSAGCVNKERTRLMSLALKKKINSVMLIRDESEEKKKCVEKLFLRF